MATDCTYTQNDDVNSWLELYAEGGYMRETAF